MSRFEEISALFAEYDMFAQKIDVLKEPNVYKAVTPYGQFVCKRTSARPERLERISEVLRKLQRKGWKGAVPFVHTKYDDPFVRTEHHLYYLTQWQPGGEQWRDQPMAWAPPTVERLGELHALTQNYQYDDPRQVESLVDSLLNRWQNWIHGMEEAVGIAQERSYPSPFDIVFLANLGFVREVAKQATEMLEDWKERHQTHARFRLSLVHGYPHPAHIVPDYAGKGRLINFDRAGFDTPVRDLTLFYRTYFQMAGDEEGASQLFHTYSAIFPLRPDEVELLAAFLTYPEKVLRDIDTYYGNRRNWSELYAVKRLEKNMDRTMRLYRWIRKAF